MRRILLGLMALVFLVGLVFGQVYKGTYARTAAGVTLTLVLDQDAAGKITGSLSSTAGVRYSLRGTIEEGIATGTIEGSAGQSSFEAEFEGATLVFTLMEVDPNGQATSQSLEFTRAPAAATKAPARPPASPQGSPRMEAPPPTDNDLMKYFAGEYYSYTSGSTLSGGAGTERTVTLCPDGLFRDSYEFSASGGGWGGATSQAGAARWTIQGDRTRGVITVVYANGQARQHTYQVVSKDQGTIQFDGVLFAYAGAPKCR
jgi:hypothetical protein